MSFSLSLCLPVSVRAHPHGSPSPIGTPSSGRRGRQLPQLPAKSSSIEQGMLFARLLVWFLKEAGATMWWVMGNLGKKNNNNAVYSGFQEQMWDKAVIALITQRSLGSIWQALFAPHKLHQSDKCRTICRQPKEKKKRKKRKTKKELLLLMRLWAQGNNLND